jgi:hydrogenase nickel incorporation protein HypA/HybF
MHELAIAESIVQAVSLRAAECKTAHVNSVRLQIGEANAVVEDSLTFCFEMVANDFPVLAGAKLLIDTIPHCAHCIYCDQDFPVIHFVVQCPQCGKWDAKVISGTEFSILEMEIATPTDEE